jgi:hypothetical protein
MPEYFQNGTEYEEIWGRVQNLVNDFLIILKKMQFNTMSVFK